MDATQTKLQSFAGLPEWAGLYRLAAIGALLSVAMLLLDMGLSLAGGDVPTGSLDAAGWLAALQASPFIGLRNLGLFNVLNTLLMLPLYLALYRLLRGSSPAFAALALVLFVLGAAVYDANNRALALLALSQQHAAAGEAQRALLETAAAGLLAQGEDFTPGAYPGFFLSSAATLAFNLLMLRSGIQMGRGFSRAAGWGWVGAAGLIGTGLLLVFTTSVTFAPASFTAVMPLALIGGLLMLGWNIAVALGLLRMASGRAALPARAPEVSRMEARG